MNILGISEIDNDAGAALLVDGKVAFAANEERFSRVKAHRGFPTRTIEWILKASGLSLKEIDRIAIAKQTSGIEWSHYVSALNAHFRSREPRGAWDKQFLDRLIWYGRNVPRYWHETGSLNREISSWLKQSSVPTSKVIRVLHHPAHAACAYFFSGCTDALIVTMDGQGLGTTATISIGRDGRITPIHSVGLPNSVGNFYGMVTKVCGFKPNRHEGKITGLAAYGKEVPEVRDFVNEIVEFRNGTIIGNCIYGNFFRAKQLLNRYGREALSYAFQKRLEEIVVSYIGHFWNQYRNLSNIVVAGGVFANVKLNQRIKDMDGVNKLFVFPHMADGGLSVGAAALLEPNMEVSKLRDAYLGPEYSEFDMRKAVEQKEIPFSRPKNITGEIARYLSEGRVVARFAGRMEFGPRALGNRSILYHSKEYDVNNWLNHSLQRSEFMPFAPVTLAEYADKCFMNFEPGADAAQFMTVTFDCTPEMQKESPAVVHVDGTARPQVISLESNPEYYQILSEYHRLTNIPSLVNTSFNMHEEPIVCSPEDAVRAFLLGNIDILAMGPFLMKNAQGITFRKTPDNSNNDSESLGVAANMSS